MWVELFLSCFVLVCFINCFFFFKVFAPLKSKFVSSVATFAEVCLAVVRVPGLEDVTEGKKKKKKERKKFFSFLYLTVYFCSNTVWSWGSGAFGLLGHDYLPSDAEERFSLSPSPLSPLPFPLSPLLSLPNPIPSLPFLPSPNKQPPSRSGIFATPREIGTLRDDTIVDLSISSTHAMCCNAVGEVYVWGRNTCTKMIGTVAGVLGPTGKEGEDFIMVLFFFQFLCLF